MLITIEGTTQPITEWALDYGIPCRLIRDRLGRGWSEERAVTEPMRQGIDARLTADDMRDQHSEPKPVTTAKRRAGPPPKLYAVHGQELTMAQWSVRLGVKEVTLRTRLKHGWPLEHVFASARGKYRRPRAITGRILEHDGKAMRVNEWAVHLGIDKQVIQYRLRQGWPLPMVLDGHLRQGGRPPAPTRH